MRAGSRLSRCRRLLESFGDDEHPVDVSKLPALVAYVSLYDRAPVLSECLRQAGWESKVTDGGLGLAMDVPSGQESQVWEAQLACEAMYTVDARHLKLSFEGKPTRAMLEAYYEYESGFLRECIARFGYTLKLPTKEVYIARHTSGDDVVDTGYPMNDPEVVVACPQDPPDDVLCGGPP